MNKSLVIQSSLGHLPVQQDAINERLMSATYREEVGCWAKRIEANFMN